MNLETLCEALNINGVRYAIVGGHAVALHGAVRGTVDYDFVINWNLKNLQKAEQALLKLGLVSRHPLSSIDIFNFKDEYVKNKNMIAWNFYDPTNPLSQVDIVITYDLKGRKIKNINFKNIKISIINIDDLISMKVKANREQDKEDVKALKKIRNEN